MIPAPQGSRGTNVLVVGMFTRFEIWLPEKFAEGVRAIKTESLLNKIDTKGIEPGLN